jgi:hypothetical protein
LALPSSTWNTVLPQIGQKLNVYLEPWSPTRSYSVAVPVTLNGRAKAASVANTLPVRR